jgi:hypothetical protein
MLRWVSVGVEGDLATLTHAVPIDYPVGPPAVSV